MVLAVIILTGFYAYIHCAVFRKLFKKYTKVKDGMVEFSFYYIWIKSQLLILLIYLILDTSNMSSYKIYTKYLKIDYDNI